MSSSPSPAEQKLEPRISVMVGEEERTLFMSFGLLNELSVLVGGPEAVPQLSFNAATAQTALELMLAPRDKFGKIVDSDEPLVPLTMTPESAEVMIDWAAGHVLDFFIRRFAKSAKLFGDQATNLAVVGLSLTSSANSPGKTA